MSKRKWFFLIVIGLGILYAINQDLFVQLTPAQKRLKLVDSLAKDYANSCVQEWIRRSVSGSWVITTGPEMSTNDTGGLVMPIW